MFAPFKSYVNYDKLDKTDINIRTNLPVVITMSTIPARLPNALKIIKHFLKQVKGVDMFVLNIPWKYKRWPNLKVDVVHSITDPRFVLNRCDDIGPLTKFLPTLDIVPNNAIIIIRDDMCYKLDAFKDIAERQDRYRDRAFSFYVYEYKPENSFGKSINVPQGADLISMTTSLVRHFPNWFQKFIDKYKLHDYNNSPCFFVDDLVMGFYFSDHNIPMEQYERKHRNIYIKECEVSDTSQNLNKQKGKNERKNVMSRCYNNFNQL